MTPARRLIALPGGRGTPAAGVLVCGHCADRPAVEATGLLPAARVCADCGLGLLFVVAADLAPAGSDPFLLIDRNLQVSGVSRAAERLLGDREVTLVGRPLGEVLAPADVDVSPRSLAARVVAAAEGGRDDAALVVRPPDEFGVRWWLRIAPCGPPRGALLVLAAA